MSCTAGQVQLSQIPCRTERNEQEVRALRPWGGTGSSDRAEEFGLLLQNLADVARNYQRAGIHRFVLAYFVRDGTELQALRKAAGLPLRVARLEVLLAEIEHRLATDITSGRREDLRQAASSIAASEGAGIEDVVITNDRPIAVIARELMTLPIPAS